MIADLNTRAMQKNLLILPFSAALVLLVIFWSCKKSSSSSSTSSSPAALIASAPWKYDTSGVDLNGDNKIDAGDLADTLLKPCQKDDIFTFNKDSTGTIDEGASKCNVGDPQTTPLFWDLTGSDKVLNVTSLSVLNGSLNIYSLSSTQMLLYKDTTVSGLPISLRYLILLKH